MASWKQRYRASLSDEEEDSVGETSWILGGSVGRTLAYTGLPGGRAGSREEYWKGRWNRESEVISYLWSCFDDKKRCEGALWTLETLSSHSGLVSCVITLPFFYIHYTQDLPRLACKSECKLEPVFLVLMLTDYTFQGHFFCLAKTPQ